MNVNVKLFNNHDKFCILKFFKPFNSLFGAINAEI